MEATALSLKPGQMVIIKVPPEIAGDEVAWNDLQADIVRFAAKFPNNPIMVVPNTFDVVAGESE